MELKELDIHQIWKNQIFQKRDLQTQCGMHIDILHPGTHNESDSGPDFFNANIVLEDLNWSGNIEIHIYASDWVKHLHHFDEAYQSIILHVVWYDDMGKIDGLKYFPTLELSKYTMEETLVNIKNFRTSKQEIPCANLLYKINSLDWIKWKEELLIERFIAKVDVVKQIFKTTKSWEETAFRILMTSMGAKVNKQPFSMLGNYLPYQVVKKEKYNPSFVEALILGSAGMLDENFSDDYLLKLQEEYLFLAQKHRLTSMQKSWWKWLRMRPSNFPNIQLAVIAQNIFQWDNLVGVFQQSINWKIMHDFFSYSASIYWDNRYKPEVLSVKKQPKKLGKEQLKRIYINAIVPFNIALNEYRGNQDYILEVLDELVQIPSEKNKITKMWQEINIENVTLWDSQALIHLYNNYCSQKKCLNCNLGFKILKPQKDDTIL